MGDYAKSISERGRHTRIAQGHCLICGKHGPLSKDHVPPRGSITITQVEQVHLAEMLDLKTPSVKGIRSTNGSKFKTICRSCNSDVLGQNDGEVAAVCKALTNKISQFFAYANSPVSGVHVPFDALRYMRAMVGHVLSATTVTECLDPPEPDAYMDPLKKFVLGDDTAMATTHDVYYWFYPHKHHMSIKKFRARNNGHECNMSLLAFYPLAFMITEKNKGIYPAGAVKLEQADKSLFLSLSLANAHYSSFPMVDLRGNQWVLFSGCMAILSYPIR